MIICVVIDVSCTKCIDDIRCFQVRQQKTIRQTQPCNWISFEITFTIRVEKDNNNTGFVINDVDNH
jgi:hypothetical protein